MSILPNRQTMTNLMIMFMGVLLVMKCIPNNETAGAAGRFNEPSHTFVIAEPFCPDNFNLPHIGGDRHVAIASDVSTMSSPSTALVYIPHIGGPQQLTGVSDGWCDLSPTAIRSAFTGMVPGQAVYFHNLQMDDAGIYVALISNGGPTPFDIRVQGVIAIRGIGGEFITYDTLMPAGCEVCVVYFGSKRVELEFPAPQRHTTLVDASIRPTPDSPMILKLLFPDGGDFSFSLVAQNAAQLTIRR